MWNSRGTDVDPDYTEHDDGDDAPGYAHDTPPTGPQLVCCGKFEWHAAEGYVCCKQYVQPVEVPK
jgi:hypothetical protein